MCKMSRKMMIAGNWKMNGLSADGVNLAKEIASAVKETKRTCEFVVCPPFTLLSLVKKALRGAKVALGAQDCHTAEKGAHTGDISPVMLKDLGCEYVILGHSERRADHHAVGDAFGGGGPDTPPGRGGKNGYVHAFQSCVFLKISIASR